MEMEHVVMLSGCFVQGSVAIQVQPGSRTRPVVTRTEFECPRHAMVCMPWSVRD